MVGDPICEVEEGEAATAKGLMFCTGGLDSRAANVISLEESAAELVRVVTGEGAEDPAPLLGELLMGCPLTNLSRSEPPPPPLPAPELLLLLLLLLVEATEFPLLPSSTGMRLSPIPLLLLLLLLVLLLRRA